MRKLDILLQNMRIGQAERFLPQGATVLDIGSADGALFKRLERRIAYGVGIDPTLSQEIRTPRYQLLPGHFPQVLPGGQVYDAITMLAVLEHIPPPVQATLAENCARLLKPGGKVIVTVPSAAVDRILAVLRALRLIDGMSLEEHFGFDPSETTRIFTGGGHFRLHERSSFQLGLNNLFVFEKQ